MIKLAAFDIDGTLASRESHMISEATREAVRRLKEKQILTVIVSGRSIGAISTEIMDLQMNYLICCNGASVYDSSHHLLCQHKLGRSTIEELKTDMVAASEALMLKYEKGSHCICGQERIDYYGSFFTLPENIRQSSPGTEKIDWEHDLPIGAICYVRPENIEKYRQKYSNLYFAGNGVPDYYDITDSKATKGKSLGRLCSNLNINREEVIAFGDDDNDIDMLVFAGTGVAMGNALSHVKEVADYITDTCENDGISSALDNLGILEEMV